MLLADMKRSWVSRHTQLPVFLEVLPESPDAAACLREYGGAQVRGLTTQDRSVQLTFRSKAQHAHDAAWACYRSLLPVPPVIESEGGKLIVRPKQSPFFLNRDAKGRSTYVFNVAVIAAPDQ